MATQITIPEITPKQEKFIVDLTTQRPGWINALTGDDFEVVTDTLVNAQIRREAEQGGYAPAGLKKIVRRAASHAIDSLLKIKPTVFPAAPAVPTAQPTPPTTATPTPLERLQALLEVIPAAQSIRFAVEVDGVLKFYAVDLRKDANGVQRRWVRQLLGAPGNWNRKRLSVVGQLAIARLIAQDWKAAAHAYATKHGRCSRCDAHLSDERSRVAKAGWKCAKVLGWPW